MFQTAPASLINPAIWTWFGDLSWACGDTWGRCYLPQELSGGSFSAFLGPAFKMVPRTLLDAYFERFRALLPNSLQEALKYAVLRGVLRLST